MKATVLNVHYVIRIIGFHVTFNETWLAKVNLGCPPLQTPLLALLHFLHVRSPHTAVHSILR